ncbi:MAG: hypothetical protein WA364_03125 [Candidatus Nitrosopolaris sp.]
MVRSVCLTQPDTEDLPRELQKNIEFLNLSLGMVSTYLREAESAGKNITKMENYILSLKTTVVTPVTSTTPSSKIFLRLRGNRPNKVESVSNGRRQSSQ